MEWTVYLSGEIHTPWRDELKKQITDKGLDIEILTPEIDHAASDGVGEKILGSTENVFWGDVKSAKINAIRNRNSIEAADIVIIKFGGKYRQWNAAFDAGYAHANEKSIITIHEAELNHALKEIDSIASATCETVEQVVEILDYVKG